MKAEPALRTTAAVAAAAHSAAVLYVWWTWEAGFAGSWVAWMDFPISLVYVQRTGGAFLAWSLVVGGLWWALLGALLSLAVGRLFRTV